MNVCGVTLQKLLMSVTWVRMDMAVALEELVLSALDLKLLIRCGIAYSMW